MTHLMFALSFLLLPATPASPASGGPAVTLQRFALVIGANDGGGDRERLRFAVTDAERFGGVMGELGGVTPGNAVLLRQPQMRNLGLETALGHYFAGSVLDHSTGPPSFS